MVMLTNKIIGIGMIIVHMKCNCVQCIPKKSHFGVDFELTKSSVHVSLRTTFLFSPKSTSER